MVVLSVMSTDEASPVARSYKNKEGASSVPPLELTRVSVPVASLNAILACRLREASSRQSASENGSLGSELEGSPAPEQPATRATSAK